MVTSAGVVVADVTKRYHRRGPLVLDAVSLELPLGTITQLRGSNGSGKSTLLRMLAGVTLPTSGRIVGRPPIVGYVPERFPADLRFTPQQYLQWQGRIRGLATGVVRQRIGSLADALGLLPVARDQTMHDLSKGTTQKVAVIQALLDSPALLLMDEAWTGLDADAQEALSGLVVGARAAGSVIVFADHGQRASGLRPDATYLVREGTLRLVGPAGVAGAGGTAAAAASGVAAAAASGITAAAASGITASMRVELLGAADADHVGGLAGVLAVEVVPGGVVVTVSAPDTDALLAAVLAAGWSVRSVAPARSVGPA